MAEEELLDWELLHGSDTESTDSIKSKKISASSSVIDDGMIVSDHFAVDNLIERSGENTDSSRYGVLESGSCFRVGDGSNQRHDQGDVRVHLDVHQSGDAGFREELGLGDSKIELSADDEKLVVESEDAGESTGGPLSHHEDSGKRLSGSDDLEAAAVVEEPIEDSSKSWSDSGESQLVSGDSGIVNGEEEMVCGSEAIEGSVGNAVDAVAVDSGDESKSRETVWWKMPFVLVKYFAIRIGPVWSVSMAAAVMGFVLLGRRLYNMKKKAQRFHLKVTIDDKKVASRVMSQAARLNEVFTEVRRVPVIRPALPSPGAWPVLSLR